MNSLIYGLLIVLLGVSTLSRADQIANGAPVDSSSPATSVEWQSLTHACLINSDYKKRDYQAFSQADFNSPKSNFKIAYGDQYPTRLATKDQVEFVDLKVAKIGNRKWFAVRDMTSTDRKYHFFPDHDDLQVYTGCMVKNLGIAVKD